jgi:hypothetical protein
MKPQKNALTSATIIGILTTIAGTFGVPAVSEDATTTQLVLQIVGTLLALWGRWRQGDLTVGAAKTVAPLVLLALGIFTMGCAAPSSEQGKAAQGGSTGVQPVVNVTVTFGGKVDVSGTSSGTAAPSAASEAQNRQEGRNDIDVPIDASGLVPGAAAGKVLGGLKVPAVPKVAPVEIVPPAPVPAPAPVVPETPAPVDAPVAPTLAPIGG